MNCLSSGRSTLGIEPADHRAAGEIALDDEVIAGRGDHRRAPHPDRFRLTEDAQIGPRLGQSLIEHDAFERCLAIVDGDDQVAAHEQGREPLFRLLAGFALGDDASLMAGGEDAGDVHQLRFAGTGDRRVEAVQRRGGQAWPRDGGEDERQRHRLVVGADEIERAR